jgi:outer membrane protein TolC
MRLCGGILFLALTVISLAPSRARAQGSPATTEELASLTLDQAIEAALSHNPEIQTIAREIEAARGRVIVATSLEPPQLTVGVDEIAGARLDRAATTTLGVTQGIPFPGKRGLRGEVAGLEVRSLQADERRIQRRLGAGVKETYYFARFQEERVQSLETSEALLTEFLQTTRSRFEVGRGGYLDVVRAKVELSRLRNDLLEARREAERARADLNLLMGRPGSGRIELVTPLVAPQETLDREAAISRVVEESALLEAARVRLEAARAARKLAGKERLPDIEIQLSGTKLRDGGETTARWGTGLGLALPLWWWTAPTGMVREAGANVGREEVNLTAAQRAVRTAAEQAFETVITTRAQVNLFESSILDDIESELRAGIDAYRTDQVDALNLIDIYRTYIDSRTEYSRSLYQYLSARARLDAAGDIEP